MINVIFIFLYSFFGFNQIRLSTDNMLNYNVKRTIDKEIKYPTKIYSTNVNFIQNLSKDGHLWKSNYDYSFTVNLTDFNKYSFEHFNIKLNFEVIERIVDKNNFTHSIKNNVELSLYEEIVSKTVINQYSLEEIKSNKIISFQSLSVAHLRKEDDYKLKVLITNNHAENQNFKNINLFNERVFNINKIKISLIPKINYERIEKEVIKIEYDPTKAGIKVQEINDLLNYELVKLLDKAKINSNVFYYLFSGINLTNENFSILSSISNDLSYEFNVECTKSYFVEKDSFLKTLSPPLIKIKFVQKFNIKNVGFKKNIYVEDYSMVNKEFIISNFYSHSFLFDEIVTLSKINNQKWKIKVNQNYENYVSGEVDIDVILISNNWNDESNKEDIDSENPSLIDGEESNDDPEFKINKQSKYLKSIILFLISILMFSLILLPELFKKLKKKYWKNDKI
ncbi:hypothetical protein [Mesoplasma tabanidae]|uniref:Uncharacterized protein n=1 Tax=Mesoplasma tabanidae TaxID=219745 RepID=A0A2K8P3U4_9MOLU|nr:hypothetical protein [Mesoplasma tabanidae]ATZ21431.1 hypothetical protein MTABA_v1c02280 [Mesoplasma tabanidae]